MFAIVPRIRQCDLMETDLPLWPSWTNSMSNLTRDLSNWAGHARDADPELHNTDKEFRIRLDLSHFNPEEIKITSQDGRITVHAKHEEKEASHGFIKREITRIYQLPENLDEKSTMSSLNSNGILNIKIQKLAIEPPKDVEIPVEFKSS